MIVAAKRPACLRRAITAADFLLANESHLRRLQLRLPVSCLERSTTLTDPAISADFGPARYKTCAVQEPHARAPSLNFKSELTAGDQSAKILGIFGRVRHRDALTRRGEPIISHE
jgi:hypothetical protein